MNVYIANAINGKITVTLSGTPTTTPAITDFAITNAAGTSVTPSAISSTTGSAITLTVPIVLPAAADQLGFYNVIYKAGAAVITKEFTVTKIQ